MDLISFTSGGLVKQAENELAACNDYLKKHGDGMALTVQDAKMLVENRERVLRSYGRIEFGGGSIALLAKKFCTSRDIDTHEFANALCDLTEIFYALRNDTDGEASDEELTDAMRIAFDTTCHGSVDMLAALSPRVIINIVKEGRDPEGNDEDAPLDYGSDSESEEEY